MSDFRTNYEILPDIRTVVWKPDNTYLVSFDSGLFLNKKQLIRGKNVIARLITRFFLLQKQQNSLIAGLRATNEALMKQEISATGPMSGLQADITSGASNGSAEKKDASPDSQEIGAQTEHTKEMTPSTS